MKGLARLLIVLAVFQAVSTRFETIAVALLVLIYNGLYSVSVADYLKSNLRTVYAQNNFARIRRLLHEEISEVTKQDYALERNATIQINRDAIRFSYVRGAFDFIIWVLAIWKLLNNV